MFISSIATHIEDAAGHVSLVKSSSINICPGEVGLYQDTLGEVDVLQIKITEICP